MIFTPTGEVLPSWYWLKCLATFVERFFTIKVFLESVSSMNESPRGTANILHIANIACNNIYHVLIVGLL